MAKLIACPDRPLYREWRILWCSCFAKAKTRGLSGHYRSGAWKEIAYCRWNDPDENDNAEKDSMANRIDNFPPESFRMPKNLWMKRKKSVEL